MNIPHSAVVGVMREQYKKAGLEKEFGELLEGKRSVYILGEEYRAVNLGSSYNENRAGINKKVFPERRGK